MYFILKYEKYYQFQINIKNYDFFLLELNLKYLIINESKIKIILTYLDCI